MIQVAVCMLFHWIGDFILQPRAIADQKHRSWGILSEHSFMYTVVVMCSFILVSSMSIVVEEPKNFMIVFLSLFISHFLVDAITSRITHKLYEKGKMYWVMTVIGFDQWIHLLVILMILKYVV
jgi:hypothetical protein